MESSTDLKMNKFINKLKNNKKYSSKYSVSSIKKKLKNSQIFSNVKSVRDDGIIELKTGEYACLLEINPIDLSLSSKNETESLFMTFKEIFKIQELKMKFIKLDKKINLNQNKEMYEELIDKLSDDEKRVNLLKVNYDLIKEIESDDETLSSAYYMILIGKNIEILNRQLDSIENITNNMIPRLYVDLIINKLEIYEFLCNFYYSNSNLEQILTYDLPELISPMYLEEKGNLLVVDDKEIQLITIKGLPNFLSEMYLNQLFNIPNVKACLNINDTIDTEKYISKLDNNYKFLLSDRNSTSKLSDASVIEVEKQNNELLMNDLKNGDEKIRELSLIFAIEGDKKTRDLYFKQIKELASKYQLKVDIPRLRQMETWQSFDITGFLLKDYSFGLPTLTIASGFPFTKTFHNDYTGYLFGVDEQYELPIFFDPFYLNKKSRTSHNVAVVASTGGGKSFAIKKLLVNEFARKSKIFILDAEEEYKKLILQNGGEYIDLFSKKNGIINPLQIRYIPNDDMDKEKDYPLPKHLSFLETFFKNSFEDITDSQVIVLIRIVEALYNKKGITKTTSISELENLRNTDYPIFSDLYNFLPEYKKNTNIPEELKTINQIQIYISRFLNGTDSYLFNGYTNIDLSNNLIGFNLKDLLYSDNKRLKNTQIINLLTYLNNAIVTNKINNDRLDKKYKKPICIVADEFHLFIDEDNCEILKNFGSLARRIRKYTGSLIVATQSINDFIGNNDVLRHAKAIFNNCQYQMVGMLKEADMNAYFELFKDNPLTETQKDFLLTASQGKFLLSITRKKKLRLYVQANAFEKQMMGEE